MTVLGSRANDVQMSPALAGTTQVDMNNGAGRGGSAPHRSSHPPPLAELAERRKALALPALVNQTPWQEIYRRDVGQLATGATLESAVEFQRVAARFGTPRDNH